MRLVGTTFVAITGSAGKSTTKHLSAGILSECGACRCSPGSGNEHYDVEWTVLRTERAHRYCVVETGAPMPGYLDRSLRVVRPHIAVVTQIAREHYSAYRGLDGVAKEKSKVVTALPADGVAVLNRDDPKIRAIGEGHDGATIWFGRDEASTIRLLEARSAWPEPLTGC